MATLQLQQYGRTSRVPRRPQHTFSIAVQPWQINPFFIAPVLPGETMKNLLFQCRVVTDPIKNPLIGWWAEFYFWYVKHRDLNERDVLTNMMIDPDVKPATSTATPNYYCFNGGVNYAGMCATRCVDTYFRDQGETTGAGVINGMPCAQISQMSALDSGILETDYLAGQTGVVIGVDDSITGQEISGAWLLWQQYRAANITNLTYEEYLATYGIPIPAGQDSLHRPELIRYVKDWSYPVNTVDPVTGTPSSAVSWAIAERADKDRFFREPGFLFGMCVIRPKCYLTGAKGAVVGALGDALAWLPAVLGDNPEYSVRKFAANTGPYKVAADYRVDLKDLFLYGDQWTNLDIAGIGTATINNVALPTSTMQKKYPQLSDADGLFKAQTANKVRLDGVVSLNILGMQVDTTPTQSVGGF